MKKVKPNKSISIDFFWCASPTIGLEKSRRIFPEKILASFEEITFVIIIKRKNMKLDTSL